MKCLIFFLFTLGLSSSFAQQSPPSAAPASDALTPEQQQRFSEARQDFSASHWQDARTKLLALHAEVPGNTVFPKFAAEASLNMSDTATAISLLQPIETVSPEDWQTGELLARAYAEEHQSAKRDAELQKLVTLHQSTADTRFRQQTSFFIERASTPKGNVEIYYSLKPWSQYNIYELARIVNAAGQQVERLTLESGDFDQPSWAKQHPKEAAAGERMFSLDGYVDQLSPSGERTQTHFTYAFFDGRPSYDTVRDRMLSVAAGTARPMSSQGGLPIPQ